MCMPRIDWTQECISREDASWLCGRSSYARELAAEQQMHLMNLACLNLGARLTLMFWIFRLYANGSLFYAFAILGQQAGWLSLSFFSNLSGKLLSDTCCLGTIEKINAKSCGKSKSITHTCINARANTRTPKCRMHVTAQPDKNQPPSRRYDWVSAQTGHRVTTVRAPIHRLSATSRAP